jgi:hypothetical protein
MDSEIKFASFKMGLETEMERINSSYKGIYGDIPNVLPTAKTYTELYLNDDLPWENETYGQGNVLRYIRAASAPSRDFFLSTAASAIYNLRMQEVGLGCHTC